MRRLVAQNIELGVAPLVVGENPTQSFRVATTECCEAVTAYMLTALKLQESAAWIVHRDNDELPVRTVATVRTKYRNRTCR